MVGVVGGYRPDHRNEGQSATALSTDNSDDPTQELLLLLLNTLLHIINLLGRLRLDKIYFLMAVQNIVTHQILGILESVRSEVKK